MPVDEGDEDRDAGDEDDEEADIAGSDLDLDLGDDGLEGGLTNFLCCVLAFRIEGLVHR